MAGRSVHTADEGRRYQSRNFLFTPGQTGSILVYRGTQPGQMLRHVRDQARQSREVGYLASQRISSLSI